MKAYYFSNLDKKLRYNDNRLIEVGITHEVKFPYVYNGRTFKKPTLCEAGLHGSLKALDALRYAPEEFLWIVDIEGNIEEGEDKICGSHRTYLVGFDATEMLKRFAKKVALINVEKIKPYCTEEDYDIIIRFLNGDESLREAATAAITAAWSATAAITAAWSATTAITAAWSAATAITAAWSAAAAATKSVYATAAWSAAATAATKSVYATAATAAWSATAAYNNLNKIFEEMIEEELERM